MRKSNGQREIKIKREREEGKERVRKRERGKVLLTIRRGLAPQYLMEINEKRRWMSISQKKISFVKKVFVCCL